MSERTERVKALLRDGRPLCSLTFYRNGKPNDRNAIGELRKGGFVINSEHADFGCVPGMAHAHHTLAYDPEREPVQQEIAI